MAIVPKKTFIDGIALGVFLTLLAFFILAFAFELTLFGNNPDGHIQTILTALAAIGAAYLALGGIRNQIQQNFNIEQTRKQQSLRAARAALPMALSEIVASVRHILVAIFEGNDAGIEDCIRLTASQQIMATFQQCIEFADDQSGERISQIIRYIQVLQARFDPDYFDGPIPINSNDWALVGHNRISYAISWAVLHALCDSAFRYARGSQDIIPAQISREDVTRALTASRVFHEQYPLLDQTIDARDNGGRLEMDFQHD